MSSVTTILVYIIPIVNLILWRLQHFRLKESGNSIDVSIPHGTVAGRGISAAELSNLHFGILYSKFLQKKEAHPMRLFFIVEV